MDIIQLLEVLKPLGNVITVKLDDGKTTIDTILGFLIAFSPAGVGLLALWYSHNQFEKNAAQQIKQFEDNAERQLEELRLNTKLVTEIELKKDACKQVRLAYLSFMEKLSELFVCTVDLRDLERDLEERRGDEYANRKREFRSYHMQCAYSKTSIDSYLNPNIQLEREFSEQLSQAFMLAADRTTKGERLGDVVNSCSKLCFDFINAREKEIISLVETIK